MSFLSRQLPTLALACLLLLPTTQAAARSGGPRAPEVRSAAALVMDRGTGEVLFARRADQAVPIASITKLMTALVVLDARQPLDELLEITAAERTRTRGNTSRLAVGTRLTRRELLRLALMSSENRAAQALGRSFPGGEAAFVRAMNAKALSLGMTRTRFADPTGLSSANVASPRDLAKLVAAAGRSELIRDYSTTRSRSVKSGRRLLEFRNTNPLVRDRRWDVSLQKTGFISEAGQCLVLLTRIDGRQVVMVLLNSVGKHTRVADARRLRDWMVSGRSARAAPPARRYPSG